MHMVAVKQYHINVELVTRFWREDGVLNIMYVGYSIPDRIVDTTGALYAQLCRSVGVREIKEEKDNGQD